MKTRKKIISAIIIASLAILGVTSTVFSHGGYGHGSSKRFGGNWGSMNKLFFKSLQEVDLTDEQETQIKDIMQESGFWKGDKKRKNNKDDHNGERYGRKGLSKEDREMFKQHMDNLRGLMMKDSLQVADLNMFIDDAHRSMEEFMGKMENNASETIIQIHQLLDQEQRTQLVEEMNDEIEDIGKVGFMKKMWRSRGHSRHIDKITEALALDSSQQKMLEELGDSFQKNREDVQLKRKEMLGESVKVFAGDNLTAEMLQEDSAAMHMVVLDAVKKELPSIVNFQASLSDDQKQKMADYFEKIQNKRKRK